MATASPFLFPGPWLAPFLGGLEQLVAADKTVLIQIDFIEVFLQQALGLILADLAVLVGIEPLDEIVDTFFEDFLARGLERRRIDFPVLAGVEFTEHIVDALHFLGATFLAGAHLDERPDGVRQPFIILYFKKNILYL